MTEATPALLRVSLLGSPSFRYTEQPFPVDRVQNRALLYRLATQLEPVSRAQVAFLFWADEPDSRAQRLLTQLLSHVRRSLPAADLLLTSKEHIQLDPTRVWSDAAHFHSICSRREQAPLEHLLQAVDLYHGSFLDGVTLSDHPEYESWITAERYRFEQLYLDTLDHLIAHFTDQGQYRQAIELAKRSLAIDELAEDVHRQLIACYAASGDRSAAVQQYERCAQILEQQLGVSPLPETTAVYQAALTEQAPAPAPPALALAWETLPAPQTPLIGRQEMLQGLLTTFLQVQKGQGQIGLLTGEAGIGKSRLLQEFATGVQEQALILTAACHASTQAVPYQPLVDALRPALRQAALLRRVPALWLHEAALLFPELLDHAAPAAEAATALELSQARGRLFEALRTILLSLADSDTPVLLCLDDLHWADATTLAWLEYLARHLHGSHLFVLATYRTEEAEALADLRWALGRLHVRTEWTLTALAKEQVRQVLEQLQVPTAETLTVRLHDATGGNPFFLLETIQELREAGRLTASPESSQELPLAASVRETVQHRLERLQPVARQVLEAGAVWGPTFTFEIVRQTAGRSELETVDGLDELVGRHLLREDAQGFCFHHELARSAVYRTLSQLRRRVLHRRAAQTLEGELSTANESQRARVVAQLGFHYAEAGEAVCAVAYLLKAGDYARNLYEHEVAVAQYQQALRLLRTQDDPAATARVLMKLGLTYHTALDYGQARAAFEEGFSLYQRAARTRLTTPMPAAPHPLRVGNALPSPATCDPAYASDISSVSLCQQLFSGLVTLNSEFDIIPDVAQRWEVLGGGRTYVFHLRQDVYWTDGTAVTAHDFDYAWKRVLKPETKSPSASLLYDIQGAAAYHQGVASDPNQVGIQALDARTLAVTLAEPVGYFLALLAHAVCLPVPRHVVERAGEQWTAGGQPVTNGPFRLVQWAQDEAVRLTRYVNYHGVFPGNVHEVILLASTDWSTHLQRYRAGELDVLSIHYPPTPAMNQARQQFAGDYASLPSLYTDFVTFDVTRPPFQDTRVRQALALALDKEVLADVILQGYVFPATGGFLPPTMPGHAPQTVLAYNPRRAQQLLAEAGYPGGQGFPPVEWLVPQWLDILTFAPIASYMQAQWREHLGINFTYQLTDWPIFVERVTTTPPQILMATWDADYPDPDNFLRKGPAQLYARWQDEVFDWLVEDARNSLDQAERMGIYQQLDRMVVEEAVIIPLTYSRMHLLIQPWLQAYPTSSISWWFWKDVVIAPH